MCLFLWLCLCDYVRIRRKLRMEVRGYLSRVPDLVFTGWVDPALVEIFMGFQVYGFGFHMTSLCFLYYGMFDTT